MIEDALRRLAGAAAPAQEEAPEDIFSGLVKEGILTEAPTGDTVVDKFKSALDATKIKAKAEALEDLPVEAVILKTALDRNIPVSKYKQYTDETTQLKNLKIDALPAEALTKLYAYLTGYSDKVATAAVGAFVEEGTHTDRFKELVDAKLEKLNAEMEQLSAQYGAVETEIHEKYKKSIKPVEDVLTTTSKVFNVDLTEDTKASMKELLTPVTRKIKGKTVTDTPLQEILSNPENLVAIAYLASIGGFAGKLNLAANQKAPDAVAEESNKPNFLKLFKS